MRFEICLLVVFCFDINDYLSYRLSDRREVPVDKLSILKDLNKISRRLSDNELRLYLLMLAAVADNYHGTILRTVIGESIPLFTVPERLAEACSQLQEFNLIEMDADTLSREKTIVYRILAPAATDDTGEPPTDRGAA